MRTWSERNGRAIIIVTGFSFAESAAAFVAGMIVLAGCIASLLVLS